jgi:hypothetical protein
MNFLVSDIFENIKSFLSEGLNKEEISLVDKEDKVVFHMHGLAGFYGPKLVLAEGDTSVSMSFKLFSILENKINFQCDCKSNSIHLISEKDIPLKHKDITANITDDEIKNVANVYTDFFKKILDYRDEISYTFFKKAGVLNGDLIFNKIQLDVKEEEREYRIGIKDNRVYFDDVFNEGYFPVQSHFQDVFSSIYEDYLNSYPFEEIKWYVLKKEDKYLKVDEIKPSTINPVKKFSKEEIVETCCFAVEKIKNRHLAES